LTKAEYADCNAAVKRIYDRADMEKIRAFVGDVPYKSDLQKEFYDRYITARLEMILRPAYELDMSDELGQGIN